jgi:FtsZ-interacting cell division protein YlmF
MRPWWGWFNFIATRYRLVNPGQHERFSASEPPLGYLLGSSSRMSVVDPKSFDDGARAVADAFKLRQPVILNLQRADEELSRRIVDFCAGLAYALDGRLRHIADRLFLLTPEGVEVSRRGSPTAVEPPAFFNRS